MDFDVPGSLRLARIRQQENSTQRIRDVLLDVQRKSSHAKFDLMGVNEDQDFWLVMELDVKAHRGVIHPPYLLMLSSISVGPPACSSRGKTQVFIHPLTNSGTI